jgi:hypothetical protein
VGDPDDMHTLVFQDSNHVQHVNSTVYYTGRDAVVHGLRAYYPKTTVYVEDSVVTSFSQ